MDGSQFDVLSRALADGHSRRGLTRLLGGLILGGPLTELTLADSAAKSKKRKRRKKRSRPAGPTCFDGTTNGGESDVDCGGACPRCRDGQRCASGSDCESGFCTGTCQRCSTSPNTCNPDAAGPCSCRVTPEGNVCVQSPILTDSCDQCPDGTVVCEAVGIAAGFLCFQRCGTQ